MDLQTLHKLLDSPIAYHRIFVDWAGSVTGAVMLSQLFYWSKRTSNAEGWVYKTAKEWEEETGLSVREQATARRCLRDVGLVEEKLKGIPPKVHFRITGKICNFAESAKLNSPNQRTRDRRISEIKTENTAKNTNTRAEDSPGECANFGKDKSPKNGYHPMVPKFVRNYAKFSIQRRWHAGKRGSTINGWAPKILQQWEGTIDQLLQVHSVSHVKEVMMWYFETWQKKYVPKCLTLKTFCERFPNLELAMAESRRPKTEREKEDDIGFGTRITEKDLRRNGHCEPTVKTIEDEEF